MPNKIVYNACFGGFSLSKIAVERMAELGSKEAKEALEERKLYPEDDFSPSFHLDVPRHDTILVRIVEELGDAANGSYAKLRIHIIDGSAYDIDEYDGNERVIEPHNYKWIKIEEQQ